MVSNAPTQFLEQLPVSTSDLPLDLRESIFKPRASKHWKRTIVEQSKTILVKQIFFMNLFANSHIVQSDCFIKNTSLYIQFPLYSLRRKYANKNDVWILAKIQC